MGSAFDYERSLVVLTPEGASAKIWTDLSRRHKRTQFLWNRVTSLRLQDVGESEKSRVRTNDDPRLQLLLMRRDDIARAEKSLEGLEEAVERLKCQANDEESAEAALNSIRVITGNIIQMRSQILKHQEQMQKQLDAYQDDVAKESRLIGGLLTAATELVAKQKMHREKLEQAKDLHSLPDEELQSILSAMDKRVDEKLEGAEMVVIPEEP